MQFSVLGLTCRSVSAAANSGDDQASDGKCPLIAFANFEPLSSCGPLQMPRSTLAFNGQGFCKKPTAQRAAHDAGRNSNSLEVKSVHEHAASQRLKRYSQAEENPNSEKLPGDTAERECENCPQNR